MIHGRRVSHRDCVTCQWVATRQGLTTSSEEDILYLCICLYFELKTQTRDNRHPSLTHMMSIDTRCADRVGVTPTWNVRGSTYIHNLK